MTSASRDLGRGGNGGDVAFGFGRRLLPALFVLFDALFAGARWGVCWSGRLGDCPLRAGDRSPVLGDALRFWPRDGGFSLSALDAVPLVFSLFGGM